MQIRWLPLKLFNFAPKRNTTYMSGTPFPTYWVFTPTPRVRTDVRAYADIIIKFSGIDSFQFSIPSHDGYGAPLRPRKAEHHEQERMS